VVRKVFAVNPRARVDGRVWDDGWLIMGGCSFPLTQNRRLGVGVESTARREGVAIVDEWNGLIASPDLASRNGKDQSSYPNATRSAAFRMEHPCSLS